MVFTSYAGCTGSLEVLALPLPSTRCKAVPQAVAQNDGCFHDVSPVSLAMITDGLSNTIFVTEKSTTLLQNLNSIAPKEAAEHGWYVTGNWGDTLLTAFYPPNASHRVAQTAVTAVVNSSSSLHPGGINVLMGDASVRFVKETVQSWPFDPISGNPAGILRNPGGWWDHLPPPGIWQALATRNGGESFGTDSY